MSNVDHSARHAKGHWIRCQRDDDGTQFWIHSITNDVRDTLPPNEHERSMQSHLSTNHYRNNQRRLSLSRRQTRQRSSSTTSSSSSSRNRVSSSSHKSSTPPARDRRLNVAHPTKRSVQMKSSHSSQLSHLSHSNGHSHSQRHRKKGKPRSKTTANIHYDASKLSKASKHKDSRRRPQLTLTDNNSVEMKDPEGRRGSGTGIGIGTISNTNHHRSDRRPSSAKSSSKKRGHKHRSQTTVNAPSLSSLCNKKRSGRGGGVSSQYDIAPNADLSTIYHTLLGYDPLDLDSSIAVNDHIRSHTASVLNYRYQSLSCSQQKQFKPPLNDKRREIRYFRDIAYPSYRLDTNEKIRQIITQNIYDHQTPYLRIRIPLNLSTNVFGNNNLRDRKQTLKLGKMLGISHHHHHQSVHSNSNSNRNETKEKEEEDEKRNEQQESNETFNIELSPDDILNTTVQEFFHSVVKQISSIRNDAEIERRFLGEMTHDHDEIELVYSNHSEPHYVRNGNGTFGMNINQKSHLNRLNGSALTENQSVNMDSPHSMHSMTSGLSESELLTPRSIESETQKDWSRIAIKAKGLEEYS